MKQISKKLTSRIGCFIEIDPGYHRTGVDPANFKEIDEILKAVSENDLITFKGFLCHAGQSYSVRSVPEILKVHKVTTALMRSVGRSL
ncbi:MAG: hypothetical protein WDN75_09725 [Bacteroidota bacterium]